MELNQLYIRAMFIATVVANFDIGTSDESTDSSKVEMESNWQAFSLAFQLRMKTVSFWRPLDKHSMRITYEHVYACFFFVGYGEQQTKRTNSNIVIGLCFLYNIICF